MKQGPYFWTTGHLTTMSKDDLVELAYREHQTNVDLLAACRAALDLAWKLSRDNLWIKLTSAIDKAEGK